MEQFSVLCWIYILILTLFTIHIDTSRPPIRTNKLVSYSIPDKRLLKQALGFNEDIYLNFTELTTKYKFPTEVHSVTTEDGYVLNIFRILSKCSDRTNSYPVFMMHGLFDTSDMWIIPSTDLGLGYVLATNCYDVWAANGRGNNYSRRHIRLDPNKDPTYWEYSFDETGRYDLPAIIDYILQKTGYPKLFFVGHSQGTTEYFVMGSLRPEYNNKVFLAVQLGPVAWMKYLSNRIAVLLAQNYEVIKDFLVSAGYREVFPRQGIVHHIAEFLCQKVPALCEVGFTLSTGHKQGTMTLKTISIAIGHLFSGTSIKNLSHFAQLVNSGKFQRYDEGIKGNLQRYGLAKPSEYNVSLISSPIVLFSAENDRLSSLKDVDILISKLPNLIENYIVPRPYWSHHNHIWDIAATELVHPKILKYFDNFKNLN
ncbi:unnamed protein product [Arctia plantaginis]|uniref:Lipase n=1 Tax=Arctia plantaginis TaxID=874455 RepID=A0A8S1BGN6_ARCPL|nr:unnamed protein product [Arctia plantaginis]